MRSSSAATSAARSDRANPHRAAWGRKLTLADDGARAACAGDGRSPHPARGDRADIIVLITESGLATDVKRGENHGKVLKHAPVVRYLATVGQIEGDASTGSARADIPLSADWQREHLAVVAFVQEVRGRAILAAASVPLKIARQ